MSWQELALGIVAGWLMIVAISILVYFALRGFIIKKFSSEKDSTANQGRSKTISGSSNSSFNETKRKT